MVSTEPAVEKRSAILFAIRILGIGLTFFLNVFLARLLGVEQYANYIYVFTWLSLLLLIGVMGFDTSVLKFVPLYREKKEGALLNGILKESHRLVLIACVLLSLLGSMTLSVTTMPEGLRYTFYAGFITLPFFALLHLRCSWLQAVEDVVRSQLIHHILRPTLFITAIFFFATSVNQSPGSIEVLLLWLPAILLLILYSGRKLQYVIAESIPNVTQKNTRLWITESSHLLLISGLQFLLARTDVVMLGMLADTTTAGIYAVASQIAGLAVLGHMVSSAIISPRFSSLHAAGKFDQMQALLNRAARVNLVVSGPAVVGMVLFGDVLLSVYGADFTSGYISLVILAVSQLLASMVGAVGLIMTLTGHHREAARIIGGSALLNIALNIVLIPIWGATGAAIATALSAAGRSLLLFVFVRKQLQLFTCLRFVQKLPGVRR